MSDLGKRCQVCGKYTDNLKSVDYPHVNLTFYFCEDCYKKRRDFSSKQQLENLDRYTDL